MKNERKTSIVKHFRYLVIATFVFWLMGAVIAADKAVPPLGTPPIVAQGDSDSDRDTG
jgi:hypothetical protein